MTKNQFLKYFNMCDRNTMKPYLDKVKQYGGKLSYYRMWQLIAIAIWLGNKGNEILAYIDYKMGE